MRKDGKKTNSPYKMSIREVAKELGLTRQQVVEAEKRAKKKLEKAGLKEWL